MMAAGPEVRPRKQPPAPQPTDAELAQRIADGDRTAAGVLVQRYQSMVRSFLIRLSGRDDVADDLAQETFIRVLQYAGRYDPKYPMRTWLFTIARRLWINHLRRGKHRKTVEPTWEQVSNERDPADAASRADRLSVTRQVLDTALMQLSEPQRPAVVLFHQQDMSMAEMAEVMKMPVGTVKSHLHRARAALRHILTPQLETIQP